MMQGGAKGNNVLHMCVIHNHEDVYVHVKDWCRQQLRGGDDVFEELLSTPNLEGQTPVMLAARLGMAKMVKQHADVIYSYENATQAAALLAARLGMVTMVNLPDIECVFS